jgi:RimJ/RimL family protein N-acetyltransferase
MTLEDLPLVWEWLQRPHVKEWWRERDTYEELVEHYLPAIEASEPTDLYVVLLDEAPIGFIQTYLVSDYPEYGALVEVGDGVAGVDLLIGEKELIGQGIGTDMLRRFVDEIVFAEPTTIACIAGPQAENAASVRAFEKAGFRAVRDFVEDGEPHTLVRRDR